jgi:hypothetical protein
MEMAGAYDLRQRQGKSALMLAQVAFAVRTGRNLLVATTKPAEKLEQLRALFPDANLKQAGTGVIVNPKS